MQIHAWILLTSSNDLIQAFFIHPIQVINNMHSWIQWKYILMVIHIQVKTYVIWFIFFASIDNTMHAENNIHHADWEMTFLLVRKWQTCCQGSLLMYTVLVQNKFKRPFRWKEQFDTHTIKYIKTMQSTLQNNFFIWNMWLYFFLSFKDTII